MAALFVTELIAHSEMHALRSIARAAGSASNELAGLRQMVDAVMNLPGFYGLKVQDGKALEVFGPFARRNVRAGQASHTEFVEIKANGRNWGWLAFEMDLHPEVANSATRCGKFLGQQLALLLNRLELLRERDILCAQAQRLTERLETRKILHRASGLVAGRRGISTQQALQILVQQARSGKHRLDQVAEMVLLGYEVPVKYKSVAGRLEAPKSTGRSISSRRR